MFQRSGGNFLPTTESDLSIVKVLPPGIYQIQQAPMNGPLYLKQSEMKFQHCPRYYGDLVARGQRIIDAFQSRSTNTGILLVGEKGTGKSLLARYVCLELGLPVIIINNPWNVDALHHLLSAVEQECVVFLDEFEKNFSNRRNDEDDSQEMGGAQNKLLTILDGTLSGKKLFLMTANNKYHISDFLLNRPGRVYYQLTFGSLDDAFIQEYCEEHLDDKSQVASVLMVSRMFGLFSFDMLQSLVAEMNRHHERPEESVKFLNMRPDEGAGTYTMKYVDGPFVYEEADVSLNISCNCIQPMVFYCPQDQQFERYVKHLKRQVEEGRSEKRELLEFLKDKFDHGESYSHPRFMQRDILEINQEGVIHYKNKDGKELFLTRSRPKDNYGFPKSFVFRD